MSALRVLLAEDDVLLREGIARILGDAGLEVVAQVGDAESLVRRCRAHRPDIALVDVQMPPGRGDDGLIAAIALRHELPDMGVLVLSQAISEHYALELIRDRAEGVGYLLKERVGDVDAFVDAVRRVASGGSVLDSQLVARMVRPRLAAGPIKALTPRERDVLAAMAEGHANREIAEELVISEPAVEKHITSIFIKLGLSPDTAGHRRVRAVLMYLRDHPQ